MSAENLERQWHCAEFLPRSVRLLGTRYRPLFAAYAQDTVPAGKHAAAADALAFVDFMFVQSRISILEPEREALREDGRRLRRRFKLRRAGNAIEAVERWKIWAWLGL